MIIIIFLALFSSFIAIPYNFFDPYQSQSNSNGLTRNGEITFKLRQDWEPEAYLNPLSAGFKILEGNVRHAIQNVVGDQGQISNIYFEEDYTPSMPLGRPKTKVHVTVNGGADFSSYLVNAINLDNTLGDGLKVYKNSFLFN